MSDDFRETTIPYPEIIKIMTENGYDGYLLSEYEGADKYDEGYEVGQTLRKQHIMLKNLLGD
jgi:sugar phosphate isomerase/epimerase